MKYQVLARKYRPKTFSTMMGQEHVLRALTNALETERLHHAYLFTGTRGVGKTTVARVLAKALNCEQGISASPCGECSTCQEIDQGCFIDLIEVDAASKTRVEDTRELLDNVQYSPTRGRFKIYLIDEVHMLSGHSFNALLKTLEEPPPHAKFLLATTDPQKLPVTILSRCLQFNLKSLTIDQIERQLQQILSLEEIPFETNVLKPLAIAADGSMRDALSLLDQSIAYSNGKPNLADVEAMLGSVQKDRIFDLLSALASENASGLVEQSRILTGQGIDVNTILAELITMLQRVALCQLVPDVIDDSLGDKQAIEQLAELILPEDIQLYYQIAINGRKDLPYSPQPQGGFEMILLRMLAFRPDGNRSRTQQTRSQKPAKQPSNQDQQDPIAAPTNEAGSAQTIPAQSALPSNNEKIAVNGNSDLKTMPSKTISSKSVTSKSIPSESKPSKKHETNKESQNMNSLAENNGLESIDLPPIEAYGQENFSQSFDEAIAFEELPLNDIEHAVANPPASKKTASNSPVSRIPASSPPDSNSAVDTGLDKDKELEAEKLSDNVFPLFKNNQEKPLCAEKSTGELADYWHDLINRSALDGLEQQLAKHSALIAKKQQNNVLSFELLLDPVHKHLLNDKITARLLDALQAIVEIPLKLTISECQARTDKELDTPRRREIHEAEVLRQQAIESINSDPRVQMILNAFAAKIRTESIKPIK